MTLAAAGDTWGIPGPTFLIYFLAAVVGVAVAVRGPPADPVPRPTPAPTPAGSARSRWRTWAAATSSRSTPRSAACAPPARSAAARTGPWCRPARCPPASPRSTPPSTTRPAGGSGPATSSPTSGSSPRWPSSASGLETAGLAVTDGQRRAARLWALVARGRWSPSASLRLDRRHAERQAGRVPVPADLLRADHRDPDAGPGAARRRPAAATKAIARAAPAAHLPVAAAVAVVRDLRRGGRGDGRGAVRRGVAVRDGPGVRRRGGDPADQRRRRRLPATAAAADGGGGSARAAAAAPAAAAAAVRRRRGCGG